MILKFFITLLVAFLNMYLGCVIYKKNQKNKSNRFYCALCISGGIWAIFMAFLLVVRNTIFLEEVILKGIYSFALLPPLFYLLFSYYFPYIIKKYSKLLFGVIYSIPLLLIFLVFFKVFKMENISIVDNKILERPIFPDYLFLTIYFFCYIAWGLIILFGKLKKVSVNYKNQIFYLVIATFLTFIITGTVSIIFPLVGDFSFDWLGPIFLLIHFVVLGYLIFYKPTKV